MLQSPDAQSNRRLRVNGTWWKFLLYYRSGTPQIKPVPPLLALVGLVLGFNYGSHWGIAMSLIGGLVGGLTGLLLCQFVLSLIIGIFVLSEKFTRSKR